MVKTKNKRETRSSNSRTVVVSESKSSTSPGKRGGIAKQVKQTVVTKTTTVNKGSIGHAHNHQSIPIDEYEWQRSPKTDYTYARSGTYSVRHLGKACESPNMSRQSLKGKITPEISVKQATLDQSQSEYISSLQSGASTSGFREASTSNLAVEESERQQSGRQRQPASATRSGCRYGLLGSLTRSSDRSKHYTSTLNTSYDTTDLNASDYKHLEKKLEYSGEDTPYKEKSLRHLYGLDQAEEEISDTESYGHSGNSYHNVSHSRARTTHREPGLLSRIFSYLIITVTKSWEIITQRSREDRETEILDEVDTRLYSQHNHVNGFSERTESQSDTDTETETYSRNHTFQQSSESTSKTTSESSSVLYNVFYWLAYLVFFILWFVIGAPIHFLLWIRSAVGGSIYSFISKAVYRDVWFLAREERRRGCGCCWLPLLLFALLVTGGSYLYREGAPEVSNAWLPSLILPTTVKQGGVAGGYSKEEIEQLFLALFQQKQSELKTEWHSDNHQIIVNQQQIFNNYKSDVQEIIKNSIQRELGAFAAVNDQQNDQDQAGLVKKIQMEQSGQIKAIQNQIEGMIAKSEALSAEIEAAKVQMNLQDEQLSRQSTVLVQQLEEQLGRQKADIAGLQTTQKMLGLKMKECCRNDSALAAMIAAAVQDHLDQFMAAAMGGGGVAAGIAGVGGNNDSKGSIFANWVHNELDAQVAALAAKLTDDVKMQSVAAAVAAVAAAATTDSSKTSETKTETVYVAQDYSGLSEENVKAMIREALFIFGADKTGMVDYALESVGGSILGTRCTETYTHYKAQMSLLGIPLWYNSKSPRTVIQPDMHPGECWAFKGSMGFLVIELARMVKPTAFSLEHIPKSLSPTGNIDSAPKDFSVWGLDHERDIEGVNLGNYTYDKEGEPLQFFSVRHPDPGAFNIVELRIETNHGHVEFTCLYRFRVHGILQKT